MSNIGKFTALFGSIIVATAASWAAPAAAQATRTWVSGVGDDVNPCSRTAPCKTFAGAISKTAAGGEINCIDQGAYGAVTITKSITLDCVGVTAGVLASSTNGITVNAAATDTVFIKGLDINGAPPGSPGLNGIRFLAGGALYITDTVIRNFTGAAPNGNGILFAPSGNAELFVTNTIITSNGAVGSGAGIEVKPTGTGSAKVTLQGASLNNNVNVGLRVDTAGSTGSGVQLALKDSSFAGSASGIGIVASASPIITGTISNSVIANNTSIGIVTNGSAATVRMSGNMIVNNATGVLAAGSSSLLSFGDNLLAGNTSDGVFTGAVLLKK